MTKIDLQVWSLPSLEKSDPLDEGNRLEESMQDREKNPKIWEPHEEATF